MAHPKLVDELCTSLKQRASFDDLIQGYINEVEQRTSRVYSTMNDLDKAKKTDPKKSAQLKITLRSLAEIIGARFDKKIFGTDSFATAYALEAHHKVKAVYDLFDRFEEYGLSNEPDSARKQNDTVRGIHLLTASMGIPTMTTRTKIRQLSEKYRK